MTSLTQKLGQCGDEYHQWHTDRLMTWCDGCGNYSIQTALKSALALAKIKKEDVLFCYDVGCSGNASDKIEGYTIHGLHGRVLPLAAGCRIGNKNIHIIAEAGDGATFSEGAGHLVHAVRNNYPLLFIHHNNHNYGLTTGQPSAMTPHGCQMNAAPQGVTVQPLSSLDIVLACRPSWVARSSSVHLDHMIKMISLGLQQPGFAFLEILQTCPTYDHTTSNGSYLEKTYMLEPNQHDTNDTDATHKLLHNQEKIALGVLYENNNQANFWPTVHQTAQSPALIKTVTTQSIKPLLKTFYAP